MTVCAQGIVAKRSNTIYFAGQRNRAWITTAIRTRGTVLAIGFVGSSRSVAALVLGAYTADGRLEQVGHVSSGLSVSARRQLRDQFRPLERPTSPLPDDPAAAPDGYSEDEVCWLTPATVVEVDFRELTSGGLRHPSYKGTRLDIDPASVRVEDLQ